MLYLYTEIEKEILREKTHTFLLSSLLAPPTFAVRGKLYLIFRKKKKPEGETRKMDTGRGRCGEGGWSHRVLTPPFLYARGGR